MPWTERYTSSLYPRAVENQQLPTQFPKLSPNRRDVFLKDQREASSCFVSSSIAYELAHYNPIFLPLTADKLKSDVSLTTADIGRQLSGLIVGLVNAGDRVGTPAYSIASLWLKFVNILQPCSPADLYALPLSRTLYSFNIPAHERAVDILQRAGALQFLEETIFSHWFEKNDK